MSRLSFTRHPATVGESYREHLRSALGFGLRMMGGGLACSIHALLPFLFTDTGSAVVVSLNTRMVTRRRRSPRSAGKSGARVNAA